MIDIYKLLKLPTKIKKTHIDEIMKVMKYDKKITKDTLKFIILKKLNLAIPCDDIDETIVKDSINKNMG